MTIYGSNMVAVVREHPRLPLTRELSKIYLIFD